VSPNHLPELAANVIKRALAAGATDAECTVAEGNEFSANVRMRELESLKEAGSRGVGVRVLVGKRTGSSSTSDLSPEGLDWLVRSAMELAKVTNEDPHAGLPDPEEMGAVAGDLALYSPDVAELETQQKIDMARSAEEAALSADPRIFNSEGASFESHTGRHIFVNSRGFAGEYQTSYCSLAAVPVAREGESMERDYWDSQARGFSGLEPPEQVGRLAASRALRRLHPVKVQTQKVPVVFEPRVARSLLGNLFEAVHGMAVYRHQSFFAGKIGERIASEKLTVIDDGTIPGLFGSSPFDDEGVPSQRTVVIERGVLKSYLLNCYMDKGVETPEQIVAGVSNGFFVTQIQGFGVNIVTGDYSQGASGLWISNGELAYAVSEVTVAANLKEMLLGLEAVGSDLDFRGSVAAPTLKIGEMTVGGK
jgi:PmbA protein